MSIRLAAYPAYLRAVKGRIQCRDLPALSCISTFHTFRSCAKSPDSPRSAVLAYRCLPEIALALIASHASNLYLFPRPNGQGQQQGPDACLVRVRFISSLPPARHQPAPSRISEKQPIRPTRLSLWSSGCIHARPVAISVGISVDGRGLTLPITQGGRLLRPSHAVPHTRLPAGLVLVRPLHTLAHTH